MKKEKFKLKDVSVSSFVTNVDENSKMTINGKDAVPGITDRPDCMLAISKLGPRACFLKTIYDTVRITTESTPGIQLSIDAGCFQTDLVGCGLFYTEEMVCAW